MLQKGAEYIQQLKQEKTQLIEQADKLRSQIDSLSNDIRYSVWTWTLLDTK